ncbi:hypothetical protein NP493_477g03021 [Ridgeia piscesae]|uniref:Mediator of RNA polymerase II transcription subunit 15 n=1 Tax=Ridgeia piscesae TaxID=27915 RepID=A0AAD9KZL5_RIDPI|nr:hypothetical protein NP493_477g03021 [Ridgeia piscesae]
MLQSGNPITKTSREMENHVFTRAQSKDEYVHLVAKLIHHIQEITAAAAAAGTVSNTAAPIMLHQVDPINALQNLARNGLGPQQAGMIQQGLPQPSNMSQTGPVQGGMVQGGMVQGGMVQGGMIQGGMTQGGMAQGGMVQTGMPQAGMQQRPPFQSYQPQTRLPNTQQFVVMNQNLSATGPIPRGPMQSGLYSTQSMASPGNPGSCNPVAVPSPASARAMLSPAPGMVPSPSPQSVINPASVSYYAGSVPSPSSVALNTPGNPASVASPATGSRLTAGAAASTDEQAYLDKWKQLQKYIEPLKRMINKINKDEDRKKDLSKMKNLLSILSDSSKRLAMGTLLKCEQVLEKLELHNKTGTPASSSHSSVPAVSGAIEQKSKLGDAYMDDQNICQPLMNAIAAQVKSPFLNHSLYRTFGPALHMLQGAPLRVPSPPPAKRARVSENEVSDVLQGEIARLDDRFQVSLDPLQPLGSSTLQLICRLDDRRLPCIPPIRVIVPEQYPNISPSCEPTLDGYDVTPFLQKVQKILASQILKMPDRFSVTALLDTWVSNSDSSY